MIFLSLFRISYFVLLQEILERILNIASAECSEEEFAMMLDQNTCFDHSSSSPLREACRSLNCGAVKLLLRFGASADEENGTGTYPVCALQFEGTGNLCELKTVQILTYMMGFMQFKSRDCNRYIYLLCEHCIEKVL